MRSAVPVLQLCKPGVDVAESLFDVIQHAQHKGCGSLKSLTYIAAVWKFRPYSDKSQPVFAHSSSHSSVGGTSEGKRSDLDSSPVSGSEPTGGESA